MTTPAENFITSIWRRKDLPEKVLPLISRHMHPWQLAANGSSDKAFRKLALHAKRLDLLADLAEADVKGISMSKNERLARLQIIDRFREKCRILAIADSIPAPLIMGRHLIARGLKPDPEFKTLLDKCFDAQIAGEFSTLEQALKFLDKLLCEK